MNLEDLRNDLNIDDTLLDDELSTYPNKLLMASEAYIVAQQEYDGIKAKTYETIRTKLESEGVKVTEKMIEMKMAQDEVFAKARVVKNTYKSLRDAWVAKKDMLMQIAYNKRREMESLNMNVQFRDQQQKTFV